MKRYIARKEKLKTHHYHHKKKREKEKDSVDVAILKQIQSNNEFIAKCQNPDSQEDDATLYCKSIVPILRSLPVRKRRQAQLKISQILFDLEFSDE